jgi:hypothetical protein
MFVNKHAFQSESITLKRVFFNSIKQFASIVLLGKRRTGKTTWARYIVQFLSQSVYNEHQNNGTQGPENEGIPVGVHRFIAVCGNKDCEGEWERSIPGCFVVEKNKEYLEGIVRYQNKKADAYKHVEGGIPAEQQIVLIFDDCGYDSSFMHSSVIKDILSNGRHYGMYCVFLMQYITQLHPANRSQMDYIGLLSTSNQNNLKKVWTEYAGQCDFKVFLKIISAATANFGMCWIDNTLHTSYETGGANVSNIFYKKISSDVDLDMQLCMDYVCEFAKHSLSNTHVNTGECDVVLL